MKNEKPEKEEKESEVFGTETFEIVLNECDLTEVSFKKANLDGRYANLAAMHSFEHLSIPDFRKLIPFTCRYLYIIITQKKLFTSSCLMKLEMNL